MNFNSMATPKQYSLKDLNVIVNQLKKQVATSSQATLSNQQEQQNTVKAQYNSLPESTRMILAPKGQYTQSQIGDAYYAEKPERERQWALVKEKLPEIEREIDTQIAKVDSTYNANKAKWDNERRRNTYNGSFGMGFAQPTQFRNSATSEDQKKLDAARIELSRAKKAINTYTEADQSEDKGTDREKGKIKQFIDGFRNVSIDDVVNIGTLGYAGSVTDSKINSVLAKAERGEQLNEIEQLIVDSRQSTQNAKGYVASRGGGTIASSIGGGVLQSTGFMVETAATGRMLDVVRTATSKGVKLALKAAGREALRTPLRGSMMSNYQERTADQYSIADDGSVIKDNPTAFLERMYKSYATTYAEGLSEQMGNVVGGKVLSSGLKKIAPKMLGANIGTSVVDGVNWLDLNTKGFRDVLKKSTGYNGTINEFLEEEFSNVVEPLLTFEPERIKDNFTLKNQFITLGSVAVIGGTTHVMSTPGIVTSEIKTSSLRKQRNTAISEIKDETLRQGVYDAIKKGATIEDKSKLLADLDWSTGSSEDIAHAADALSWSLQADIFRGFDDSQQAEALASLKAEEYSRFFKENMNSNSGMVHEVYDADENPYYLLSGDLDQDNVDGTIFVKNAQTGQIEQISGNDIVRSTNPISYERGLSEVVELTTSEIMEQTLNQDQEQDIEDAALVGVQPISYKMDDKVVLSDGREAVFIGYLNDGSSMADVAVFDPETSDYTTQTIPKSQIISLSTAIESENAGNPEPGVQLNNELEESPVESHQREIPLTKDGKPDYDSMPVDMFVEEASRVYPREKVFGYLEKRLSKINKRVESLAKKEPDGFNAMIAWESTIEDLKQQAREIEAAITANTVHSDVKVESEPKVSRSNQVGSQITDKYVNAPKEYGVEKSIITANDESIKGRYVLLESGSVTASHDPQTFAQSAGFPVNESGSTVNDRDYGKDKDAQQSVVLMAQKYNGRAIDNPVIVSPDGVVVSGNNRTMSGELAARMGTDKAYIDHLKENAAQFGFTEDQISKLEHPRIVFQTTEPQLYNTETFAKFNAQDTKSQNKVEKAIKFSKTVSDATIRRIGSEVEDHDTLGDLYADTRSVSRLIKVLQDSGVINQNEVAELKDGDNLSAIGKDMFETVLVGSVLSENTIRLVNQDGMKRYRGRITKAIVPLLDNLTLGDYGITNEVDLAVSLLDLARRGKSSIDDALSMKDMFQETPYTPLTVALAKSIEGSDKGIKELISQYNSLATSAAHGQVDMFTQGVKRQDQILKEMGLIPSPETDTNSAADPIASAVSPQEKHRAVVRHVEKLNKFSGADAVAFSELGELKQNIADMFASQWANDPQTETPGVTIGLEVYIYSPHIKSVKDLTEVYTHEVVAHRNILVALGKDRQAEKMLYSSIVDEIGISEMTKYVSDGYFVNLVDNYFNNPTKNNKVEVGKEFVAYYAQNNFNEKWFNLEGNGKFVLNLLDGIDLSHVDQIITTANNGADGQKIFIRNSSDRNGEVSLEANNSRNLGQIGTGDRVDITRGGSDRILASENPSDSVSGISENTTYPENRRGITTESLTDNLFSTPRGNTGPDQRVESRFGSKPISGNDVERDVSSTAKQRLGEGNTIVSADRIEELRKRAKEKLSQLNSGFDPELYAVLTELSVGYIEAGVRKFADFTTSMVAEFGDKVKPYLTSMYEGARRFPGMEQIAKEMDITIYVDNYTQELKNTDNNVRNLSGNSQRHSTDGSNEIPLDERDILDADGRRGRRMGDGVSQRDRVANRELQRGASTGVLPATVSRERSDNGVSSQNSPNLRTSGIDARDTITPGYDLHSGEGNNVDNTAGVADSNRANHSDGESFAERTVRTKLKQKQAEPIPVSVMDINNIRSTLPLLLPEQQDDVYKAEIRFYSDEHKTAALSFGKGMLFTNGTGTGKTYTGFGVIKRFHKLGKKNMLIVVPAEAKIADWTKESKSFNLDVHTLESTKDKGKDISVTTYANFRANSAIKERDFDLIIYDECHRLMESNKGDYSSTSLAHFQICNRNLNDALARLKSVHPLWIKENQIREEINLLGESKIDKTAQISALKMRLNGIKERQNSELPDIERKAQKAVEKTKVLYLSATPFKSYFNLRYANGTLFDWSGNEQVNNHGSRIDAESAFMLDNFGSNFEWKYHRLQQKDKSNAEAIAMQEVEFADKLFKSGVMSSRAIESNMDYSREFPLITLGRADAFNKGFNDLFSYGESAKFSNIAEFARKIFYDYNYSTQLYESLRASMSIDRIRRHIDLGRKIVVFHRRKQANVNPPFRAVISLARKEAEKILEGRFVGNHEKTRADKIIEECMLFENTNFELLNYEQSLDYSSVIDQITKVFGSKRVVTMNGDTAKSQKSKNIELFNDDNSGVDIIVIQEEAGKEGISLHDKTGKHQRVLINMSLPVSSTTALQIEGRIYRIGQESNAIFEYPLLGLDMEIANFGQTINRKLSTTENLAAGSQARDLIRSFAEGVLSNSSADVPNTNQGRGGKEYDKRIASDVNPFNKAVLMYDTNQKNRAHRSQREGTDFYATPEPIGLKMTEMLNLRNGDSVLEPSAGDGRIAMWFPDFSNSTIIEPSYTLFSKASARAGGGNRKFVNSQFEDFNIVNKFDGIAMNPPFGSGGAMAMTHIEKAFGHLKENGRIVAIVPRGAMDNKLDDFLYGQTAQGKPKHADARLVASINLPNVAFEQSGTNVGTRIVVIDKSSIDHNESVYNTDLSYIKNVKELFSSIEDITIPNRNSVSETSNIQDAEQRESSFDSFVQQHSKTGADLYTASPKRYLGDDYKAISTLAKKHGGHYSSYSNKEDNVRAGFIFGNKDSVDIFIAEADNILSGEDIDSDAIRFREIETSPEMEQIKSDAVKRGEFMLSPNGQPSNLTEHQWLQVRTSAFKEWFGDWEKAARVEKLRNSSPVEITGDDYVGKYELNRDAAQQWLFDNVRGEYVINDTGEKVSLSRLGVKKVTSHSMGNEAHLKSISVIPRLIENSIFITEIPNEKDNGKFDSYRYYVCGLNIDDTPYTAKVAVGVKGGKKYYDHSLTEIEKGALIDNIDELTSPFDNNQNTSSEYKDSKLLEILQNNSSKVVDANGEPMVVYHGTTFGDFTEFDMERSRAEGGMFFTSDRDLAVEYSDRSFDFDEPNLFECFISAKNPHMVDYGGYKYRSFKMENIITKAHDNGNDSVIISSIIDPRFSETTTNNNPVDEVVIFDSTQIKSATDNRGTFNGADKDIRYRSLDEINDTFNDELQQLIDGSLGAGHVFSFGMPSDALLLSGVPKLPIELSATRLKAKSEQDNHKFDLSNVVNLPDAIANPIAVFDSTKGETTKVILTELSNGKDNFVVVLSTQSKGTGRKTLEISNIVSLYPKDHFQGIIDWVSGGLMRWVDKEKALNFISVQWPNYIGNGDKTKGFNSATKIIENFENPKYNVRNRIEDNSIKEAAKQREYEAQKQRKYISPDKRKVEAIDQLRKLAQLFNTEVVIVDSVRELPDNLRYATRNKRFKGLYRKSSSEVYFIASEIKDADDATATFLHEVVAHKGIDGLMGREKADQFYTAVFESQKPHEQTALLAKYGDKVVAGDELVARMAEGDVTPSVMQSIVSAIRRFFRETLGMPLTITDNDIRYLLWKSKNNLQRATTVSEVFSVIERDMELEKQLYPAEKSLMEQIKEVSIRYRDGEKQKGTVYRVSGKKSSFKSKAIQVQEGFQDSTIKVHLTQNEIKRRGGTITPMTNVYEALNHRDSIADAQMEKYSHNFIRPIINDIKQFRSKGIGYGDVTEYMLAKHSLERHNDHSDVTALAEEGKGDWTESHVSGIITNFESKLSEEELTEFWNIWRDATRRILDIAVESGRMSLQQRNDILAKKWEYYVPLRGKDWDFEKMEDLRDVFYTQYSNRGNGVSSSKEVLNIKARGRRSKASDPIAALQQMANLEIYLSAVNNVNRSLLRLAEQYSDMKDIFESIDNRWFVKVGLEWRETNLKPDIAQIKASNEAQKLKRSLEKELAKETEAKKAETLRAQIEQADNDITVSARSINKPYTGLDPSNGDVVVMKDGVRYIVRLADVEVAAAINGNSGSVQRWLSRYPGRVTRVMSQLSTSKNPAFILPNFIRDLQQATLYSYVDSNGHTLDLLKYTALSWGVLHRSTRGKLQPLTVVQLGELDILDPKQRKTLIGKYGKKRVEDTLYDIFHLNGGETGYVHILEPKDYQRKLRKEIMYSTGRNYPLKFVKGVNNGLDYMANMSENMVRFATFMSQIDNGSNAFDAVSYAKNITVNFNRKGKYSKGVGALFMFFNAGIQGALNFYSLYGNKQGKSKDEIRRQRVRFLKANAVLASLGYVSAMFMYEMLLGLAGDDGEEFQVSEYERRTNLIIPAVWSDKGYVKIPIPIIFRPFYALGVMSNDWVNGKIEPNDILASFTEMMVDAVSPQPVEFSLDQDNGWSWTKSIVPSAIKPIAEIGYNQNFMGAKINREAPYSPNTPESQLGRANTNSMAVSISKWLNELGGGNAFTPAGISENGKRDIRNLLDISPSTIEHIATSYTGGVGRIIHEAYITLTSSEKEARKIPVLNRFYGEAYPKDPSKEYYDIKRNIEWVDNNNKATEKNKVESALFGKGEFSGKKLEYKKYREMLKSVEKRIKAIEERLKESQFGTHEYDNLESQIDNLQRQFIKQYNDQRN